MAKSKVEYWLTKDGLILIEGWSRDGLTLEQISHNMGISVSSLKSYKEKHMTILNALKKGKDIVDYEIENALYEKAKNGDITACIFWLKNRKPNEWRDKRDIENKGIEPIEIILKRE